MVSLDDFPDLTPAETGLIDHLREGRPGIFIASESLPPAKAPRDLRIRASLIRALILKKIVDVPLPERGLRIQGAYIRGDAPSHAETQGLDLEGASLPGDLALIACQIPDKVLLRSGEVKNLILTEALLDSGLEADGLSAKGDLFLRGVTSAGEIRLLGAQLGGDLDCSGANLTSTGDALNADGLSTKGGVIRRGVTSAGEIRLLGAQLGGDLDCSGANLTSTGDALNADGLSTKGGVILRGVTSAGEIRLLGAQLGGDLDCGGASLTSTGTALSADGLCTERGVILRGVTSAGGVRLLSAQVGGNLDCVGAAFNSTGKALSADRLSMKGTVLLREITSAGEIRLVAAQVGGNMDCEGANLGGKGKSLNCAGAKIGGAWFWRRGAHSHGGIELTAAEIGSICDDPDCWPPEILLDRCRYGAFIGKGVDGAQRIDWLSRQKPQKYGDEFWPQPYEECARALREAGHGADARIVLIEKERLQREARRRRLQAELEDWRKKRKVAGIVSGVRPFTDRVIGTWLRLQTARVWDALLGEAVAYGRRPGKAAVWLAAFLLLGWLIFARAAGFGEIKPNLPQIQRAPEWVACGQAEGAAIVGLPAEAASGRARAGETQLACFLRQPEALAYPRFAPLIYSADTLLPIVSLEMQSYWIPDDSKPIGAVAQFYLWVHIFAGWGLTLLAVAGFSGLIKTDNTR